MKAEHRKELETNTLANSVGRALEGVKEGPSARVWYIGGAVVLAVILYFVWVGVRQHSLNTNSNLWEQWATLGPQADIEKFANEHPGTVQGRLARFKLARLELGQGLANIGSPSQHAEALGRVRKAAEIYEKLVAETGGLPLLQQEALLNSGKAWETVGDVDRAGRWFDRLVRDYPDSAAGAEAKACLARLKDNPGDVTLLKKFLEPKEKPPSAPLTLP